MHDLALAVERNCDEGLGMGAMFDWWRRRSIPERFSAIFITGLALSPALFLLGRWSLFGTVILVLAWVHGYALLLADDPAFSRWHPGTRTGRVVHAYIHRAHWLRHGDGRRWVTAAFGVLGLLLMGMVLFSVGWAIWA